MARCGGIASTVTIICMFTCIQADLQSEIQEVLERYSVATGQGYGFSAGYVGNDGEVFGVGAGMKTTKAAGLPVPSRAGGTMTENDTFILGSGTKPYTAAGIMRLVERGVLTLEDKIADQTKEMMQSVWNTSLDVLFGGPINNVTVGDLVRMQSGIADVEEVHDWEHTALNNHSKHDPMWDLLAVASLTHSAGCSRGSVGDNCVWHFAPGTQTEYCSTNFLLAGLVLLAHQPRTAWSWQTFDQRTTLTSDFTTRYPHTFFPTCGALDQVGLSCVGNCYMFGRAAIWDQDAGIMGMSWGATTASAKDVAMFYMDLLGPHEKIVSNTSVAVMEEWRLLSYGWNKGTKRYGAGLETNNPSPQVTHWRAPPLDHVATGIGHHGGTYGFEMLGGYYLQLNASITITTNQDKFADFIPGLCCSVVEVVARARGVAVGGLNCTLPRPVTYTCDKASPSSSTPPICVPIAGTSGTTLADCESNCNTSNIM